MSKITDIYKEVADRVAEFYKQPMSIGGWCDACQLLGKAFKAAAIAKEEDVSVLSFYVPGLKYICHAPKELPMEQVLESMDDSNEFYSYDEEQTILASFTFMMDQLENWAEVLDMHHGVWWRNRENTKQWNKASWDDDYYDKPPYYGWVLANINKIKNHFDPPCGEYATVVNNNPYYEKLFAYQATRQQWRFHPEIIEILLSRVTEEQNSPLVEKYIAWGAESASEVPSWCLKVKDGNISKELFEKNLKVHATDARDLIEQLNGNVNAFNAEKEKHLRDLVDDCFCGALYQGKPPVKALRDKIKEVSDGLASRWLRNGDARWAPFLAEALKLPRYDLYYFFWNNPEEGPDEPGLFYTIADGSKLEVHYSTRDSEWYSDMDNAEYELEELMRRCMNIAIESEIPNLVDDWLDIQANWDECRDANESTYHCCGDTLKFATSFCHGLMKIGNLIPLLKQKVESKVWKPSSAEEAVRHYDEEGLAEYKERRKAVEDAFRTHARLFAMSGDPFGFVLKRLKSEIEEMKSGVPQCPQDAACWQDVMKPILSYNPYISEYEAVSEDDESHFSVEGVNGEKYYLYGHSVDPEEKDDCRQIDELVGEYIKAGEKRARECGSRSHPIWVSALAGWKQSKLAWKLRSNQASIDAMVDRMKEAAGILSVDYNLGGDDSPDTLPRVMVAGYTPEGRKESVQIANTKMTEKDWFTDPNLQMLFGVSTNTPYNWRQGKGAPEGFAEAFEKKDIKKMMEIAKKYKASRERADAMNTKGVERNLSEEQMHRQRLK